MADPIANSNALPNSTDTGSASSTATRHELFTDISDDESDMTPITSPGLTTISEPKDLIDMYTSVEMGVVKQKDQRDDHMITMAEVHRNIARAERKLAQWRAKEAQVLHRLQCITQEVADRRLTQADINIERAKTFQKQFFNNPRLVESPQDILTTLTRPLTSLLDTMRVA